MVGTDKKKSRKNRKCVKAGNVKETQGFKKLGHLESSKGYLNRIF